MTSQPIGSARSPAPHTAGRKGEKAPLGGYDYQGFRLSLMDVLIAWAISGVVITLAFALVG